MLVWTPQSETSQILFITCYYMTYLKLSSWQINGQQFAILTRYNLPSCIIKHIPKLSETSRKALLCGRVHHADAQHVGIFLLNAHAEFNKIIHGVFFIRHLNKLVEWTDSTWNGREFLSMIIFFTVFLYVQVCKKSVHDFFQALYDSCTFKSMWLETPLCPVWCIGCVKSRYLIIQWSFQSVRKTCFK